MAITGPLEATPLDDRTPNIRAKTRTREHVLSDLSINYVERQILLCGFSANA